MNDVCKCANICDTCRKILANETRCICRRIGDGSLWVERKRQQLDKRERRGFIHKGERVWPHKYNALFVRKSHPIVAAAWRQENAAFLPELASY